MTVAPFPDVDGTHACADVDPELFFPHDTDWRGAEKAKAVCAGCPFRRPCLAYALTHQVAGVWGGTTEAERRSLRRRHHITTMPLYGQRSTTTPEDDDDAA